MKKDARIDALLAAEQRAKALLDAIEEAGLIDPGRTERMVEQDIYALAENAFGVKQHWHKRIVRSGINTLCIAADDLPPVPQTPKNPVTDDYQGVQVVDDYRWLEPSADAEVRK